MLCVWLLVKRCAASSWLTFLTYMCSKLLTNIYVYMYYLLHASLHHYEYTSRSALHTIIYNYITYILHYLCMGVFLGLEVQSFFNILLCMESCLLNMTLNSKMRLHKYIYLQLFDIKFEFLLCNMSSVLCSTWNFVQSWVSFM